MPPHVAPRYAETAPTAPRVHDCGQIVRCELVDRDAWRVMLTCVHGHQRYEPPPTAERVRPKPTNLLRVKPYDRYVTLHEVEDGVCPSCKATRGHRHYANCMLLVKA